MDRLNQRDNKIKTLSGFYFFLFSLTHIFVLGPLERSDDFEGVFTHLRIWDLLGHTLHTDGAKLAGG